MKLGVFPSLFFALSPTPLLIYPLLVYKLCVPSRYWFWRISGTESCKLALFWFNPVRKVIEHTLHSIDRIKVIIFHFHSISSAILGNLFGRNQPPKLLLINGPVAWFHLSVASNYIWSRSLMRTKVGAKRRKLIKRDLVGCLEIMGHSGLSQQHLIH